MNEKTIKRINTILILFYIVGIIPCLVLLIFGFFNIEQKIIWNIILAIIAVFSMSRALISAYELRGRKK